jgi:hypothetical protein
MHVPIKSKKYIQQTPQAATAKSRQHRSAVQHIQIKTILTI